MSGTVRVRHRIVHLQLFQMHTCAGRGAGGQPPPELKARLLAVVPEGAPSPLGREVAVTAEAVMRHMARRLAFADPAFHLEVFTDAELQVGDPKRSVLSSCSSSFLYHILGVACYRSFHIQDSCKRPFSQVGAASWRSGCSRRQPDRCMGPSCERRPAVC